MSPNAMQINPCYVRVTCTHASFLLKQTNEKIHPVFPVMRCVIGLSLVVLVIGHCKQIGET